MFNYLRSKLLLTNERGSRYFDPRLYLIDLTRIKEFLFLGGIYRDPNHVQIEMLEELCDRLPQRIMSGPTRYRIAKN